MKRFYWVLIFLTAACSKEVQQTSLNGGIQDTGYLVTYYESGKTGFKNIKGDVIVPARFYHTTGFEGLPIAAVVDEDGWGYINTQGEVILRPFVYDNGPDYFSEGLARFIEAGKIGFHDESGEVIIDADYDFALPFSEGMAVVCEGCKQVKDGEHFTMQGGKWGFIDKEGGVVIPLRFDRAYSFEDGKAKVRKGKTYLSIDPEGEETDL